MSDQELETMINEAIEFALVGVVEDSGMLDEERDENDEQYKRCVIKVLNQVISRLE